MTWDDIELECFNSGQRSSSTKVTVNLCREKVGWFEEYSTTSKKESRRQDFVATSRAT